MARCTLKAIELTGVDLGQGRRCRYLLLIGSCRVHGKTNAARWLIEPKITLAEKLLAGRRRQFSSASRFSRKTLETAWNDARQAEFSK